MAAPYRPSAALMGLAARRALVLYLTTSVLIMLLLLVTAWAIDLARNFDNVSAKAQDSGASLAGVLFEYLFYRAVDIVTRLLPVACFIGVFIAEAVRRRRLESVVLAGAGMSPAQELVAVAAFGLLAGCMQTGLEAFWRPAAVFAQVELGVGQYAERFRRGMAEGPRWFVSGNDAVRASVLSTDQPELRSVELFRGFNRSELDQIVVAERGVPGVAGTWRLEKAIVCEGSSGATCTEAPGGMVEVVLELLPSQLTYLDVPGFYLPNEALGAMAAMRSAPNVAGVDMAIWRRWSAALLPFAFALLGASLGQIVWAARAQSPWRIVTICFYGYATVVANKVFWSLGEIGALPASAAVIVPIVLTLAGSGVIQTWRSIGTEALLGLVGLPRPGDKPASRPAHT